MRCQCFDPACNVLHGAAGCPALATHTLYRIDQDDRTGTDMCQNCMEDSMSSGLFHLGDAEVEIKSTQWCRREERSKSDHVTRLRVVIEAADKLAEACSRLDLTDQMYRLEQYYIARREYRMDRGITDNMSETEGGPL